MYLEYMQFWVPFPAPQKTGVVVHTCNLTTWVVEAGGSGIKGYPGIHTYILSQKTKQRTQIMGV